MSDFIMQKVAEVAPRHYAFLLKTAEEIKTSPFRDEIVEEMDHLTKKALDWNAVKGGLRAGAGAAGKGALAMGGAVGAAAVGGIAMALAGDMYEAAKRGVTKGRNYKAMMEANPQLNRMSAKEVQKAFSVLHRFNPEFSGDPTVAGSWVKSRVELGGPEIYADTTQLKSLIDSRKNISDTKKLSPFKMEREKKAPPGLSKNDFHEGMNDINARFTNFEQNVANQHFLNTFKP
jgi:hypothetical protein